MRCRTIWPARHRRHVVITGQTIHNGVSAWRHLRLPVNGWSPAEFGCSARLSTRYLACWLTHDHAGAHATSATTSRRGPGWRIRARSALVPVAAVVLVASTPVATWWLVGDQSTVPLSADPGYAIRPWDIGPATAAAAGLASLAVAAAMMVLLAGATIRRRLDPEVAGRPGPAAAGRRAGRGRAAGYDRRGDRREYRRRPVSRVHRPGHGGLAGDGDSRRRRTCWPARATPAPEPRTRPASSGSRRGCGIVFEHPGELRGSPP